jgi:hypothetical protein
MCHGLAKLGVRIRKAEHTGGSAQADVRYPDEDERSSDEAPRYRFGACCIGRMIVVLETKNEVR